MKVLFLVLLFLSFNSLLAEPKELITLNDGNFNSLIFQNKHPEKWFVIFHIDTCSFCGQAIRIVKDEVLKDPRSEKYNFGIIDCNANLWNTMRFNISKIPYIVLFEGNYMYEFKRYLTKETILKFLEEERSVEERLTIPEPVSTYAMVSQVFRVVLNNVDNQIQLICDKFGLKIKWRRWHSILLITLSMVFICILESKLVNFFFNKEQKEKVNKKESKEKENEHKEKSKEKKKMD